MGTRYDAPLCADGAHVWGPVELSRFAGNPHRACVNCRMISLDLSDDDAEEDA